MASDKAAAKKKAEDDEAKNKKVEAETAAAFN